MAYFIITAFVNAISSIIIGMIVYFKNRKTALNRVFAVFCCFVASWSFFYFCWLVRGDTEESALFWGRLLNIAAIFIPITYFHLVAVFLGVLRENRWLIRAGYFFSSVIFLFGFTPFFVSGVKPMASLPWYPQPGLVYHLFSLLFAFYVVYSWYLMVRLIKKGRRCGDARDFSIKALLIGTLIGFIGGSMNFLPVYGISVPPFGNGLVLFYVVFIAFAILKFGLFQIKIILTEFLVGLMGLILIILPFLMPVAWLKTLTFLVFILFCFFGYYLIKTTHLESRRRQDAETVADELRRLDAAKNQFLLSTQHHLRSPLSVVRGYLSMLKDGDYGAVPGRAQEKIGAALEATKKMVNLVDDLLDMARFQMDKGLAVKQNVDLGAVVGEVVVDLEKLAASKNIYLRFERSPAPLPLISADARGIREAVYNIIDNAVKYTEKGGVTVSAQVAGDVLRVSVADTGIGMDGKDLQGLFERTFERGAKAKNVDINGKGIGLYLASQMVKSNGGRIFARSAGWGKGSEFIIEFPLSEENGCVYPENMIKKTK